MTGDAANADPVCEPIAVHHLVTEAVARADRLHVEEKSLLFFRDAKTFRSLTG